MGGLQRLRYRYGIARATRHPATQSRRRIRQATVSTSALNGVGIGVTKWVNTDLVTNIAPGC